MRLFRRVYAVPPRSLLGLLFVLLAVLGTLQYRWSGELSEAERARMRSGAQTRAESFAREFDREITRLFLRLGLDAGALASRDFASYAERHERWRRTSPHPDLVGEVLLVEAGAEGEPRLHRLGGETSTPIEWPAAWRLLRERWARFAAGSLPEPRADRPGPFTFMPDGTPALLLPVLPLDPERLRTLRLEPGMLLRPTGALVIVLDRAYLRERWLPALAERHFGGAHGLEYSLAVVRPDDPGAVFWQLPAGVMGSADATAGLLDLRPEEADEQDLRDLLRPLGAALEMRGPMMWAFSRRLDGPRGGGVRLQHSGRWQLRATHRAGSLDAVVAAARRRNLTVGFGMLLLLGASGALLVVSARRAERLARRQIEFVAGVTHELRTPLAVIRSAGENLADGLVGAPTEVRSYGALVRDEGRRLTEMVEQALTLAGAESGRGAVARQPLSVGRLLEDTLGEWRADEIARGVRTETDLAADLPPVLGDEAALRRALRNLLDNAVKYGGESGWVGVRARAQGQEVAVTVEDQGLGIPADERHHVFEPFYRGRDATSRGIGGSGLGLSLVRRIAESHGGHVRIEDRRAGGTAFTLTLPALTELR